MSERKGFLAFGRFPAFLSINGYRRELVLEANYPNLFLDAGVSSAHDQEKYSRCLDAVLAREGITVADIIGVGENGTGSNLDLYVVHRQAITLTRERGFFNKKIDVNRLCSTSSIARLRETQEGFKGTDLTVTANDAKGEEVLRITWGLGGPDWVEPLVLRQRAHLFQVISKAMDVLAESPVQSSVSSASSKAAAIRGWAAEVVKAAGVERTDELVEEHANMAAGGIRFEVFLRAGTTLGIDDLNDFYPGGGLPPGTPIETFDDLYNHVVARVGDSRAIDTAIDELLAASWLEFVNGCRSHYGAELRRG
jgi:hypothetical protein